MSPTGYDPPSGAWLLQDPSQVQALLWGPLGLLPQPWDRLGTAFRGRGDSGPQGEPKASRDEACKGGDISDEV